MTESGPSSDERAGAGGAGGPCTSTSETQSLTSTGSFFSNYLSTNLTQSERRTPIRYVLSGIKSTLSYVETVGIILVCLLSPLLTEPLYGCKQTHVVNHIATHLAAISVAFVAAFFVLAVFAELHHYYGDCGGLVSVTKKVSCSPLASVVLAVCITCGVAHVAYSLCNISDTVDRLTKYYITDQMADWTDSRINVVALLLVVILYTASLLGLVSIARVSALFGVACFVSVFLIGGYGISHKLSAAGPHTHNDTVQQPSAQETSNSTVSNILRDSEHLKDSSLVDRSVHAFLSYLCTVVGNVIVITLLVSLTEDNKLKRGILNGIGGVLLVLCLISTLFLNASIAHVTSDIDVFPDQITETVGMPREMILVISGISILSAIIRGLLILFSTCRVMVHVAISKEEFGVNGLPCKVLKFPMFINCCQCLLVGGVLLLKKQEIYTLALVLTFTYTALGGLCHILHRYKSADVTETAPLIGTFGALKALRTVRLLLIVLVLASVALCIADVLQDHIELGDEVMLVKGYVVMRVCLVLIVVGCISVIASFQQQRNIHKVYRWLVWTPIIPSSLVVMGSAVGAFHWFWGSVSAGFVMLLSVMILTYDKLYTHCCCVNIADDASQVS